MYLPPQTHVTPLCTVRRERFLPAPGEVLVHMNQRLEAGDVVARTDVTVEYRIVDVARLLGVSPAAADRLYTQKEGATVNKGDVVAVQRGLRRRQIRAPVSGTIIATGGGRILLAATEPLELRAGLPGTVVSLTEQIGVAIETAGALVQGVWGNGRNDFAVLRVMGEANYVPLDPAELDVTQRGTILVAGGGADAKGLERAADLPLRGLIVGSLPGRLIGLAMDMPFPVMITERLGDHVAMAAPIFTLLQTSAGREAMLDARPTDRFEGWRPEVVIPLPAQPQLPPLPPEGLEIEIGRRVRLLRGEQPAAVGAVASILQRPQTLPSGVRTPAARVDLEGGLGRALAAFANLEVLE